MKGRKNKGDRSERRMEEKEAIDPYLQDREEETTSMHEASRD